MELPASRSSASDPVMLRRLFLIYLPLAAGITVGPVPETPTHPNGAPDGSSARQSEARFQREIRVCRGWSCGGCSSRGGNRWRTGQQDRSFTLSRRLGEVRQRAIYVQRWVGEWRARRSPLQRVRRTPSVCEGRGDRHEAQDDREEEAASQDGYQEDNRHTRPHALTLAVAGKCSRWR